MAGLGWSDLVEGLKKTLSTANASHQDICDSLDRLIDAIKSGCPLPPEQLRPVFGVLLSLFKPETMWCYKHLTCFAFIHLLERFSDDSVLSPFVPALLTTLLAGITDPKREQRDAIAQTLGAFVRRFGPKGAFQSRILPALLLLEKQKARNTYEALEGLMMACGYIGANCAGATVKEVSFLVQVLAKNVPCEIFEDYSRYIRCQALRGLRRVLRSSSGKTVVKLFAPLLQKLTFARLGDTDFDTRRAAAELFGSFGVVVGDPVSLKKVPGMISKQLAVATIGWELRHAFVMCLRQCSKEPSVVAAWDVNATARIFCKELSRKPRGRDPWMPNAEMGLALAHLVLTLAKLGKNDRSRSICNGCLIPAIRAMLQSHDHHMLDASARCLDLVLLEAPTLVETCIEEFSCFVFKNRFHAAFPIRNSATKIWKIVQNVRKEGGNLAIALGSRLPVSLVKESSASNFEVREAALKGLGALFNEDGLSLGKEDVAPVLARLMAAAVDRKGKFEEVPRAAAIRAIGAVMTYLDKKEASELIDLQSILSLLETTLPQLYEGNVAAAALEVVDALSLPSYVVKVPPSTVLMPLLPSLFCLCHMSDVVVTEQAKGTVEKHIPNSDEFLQTHMNTFLIQASKGPFRVAPDVGFDHRECMSKFLSGLTESEGTIKFAELAFESTPVAFEFISSGVLNEGAFDDIEKNCLRILAAVCESSSFLKSVQDQEMLKKVILYCVNLASHPKSIAKMFELPEGDPTAVDPILCPLAAKVVRALLTVSEESDAWKSKVSEALKKAEEGSSQ